MNHGMRRTAKTNARPHIGQYMSRLLHVVSVEGHPRCCQQPEATTPQANTEQGVTK